MPRKYYPWPKVVQESVRKYVKTKVEDTSIDRFREEPAYIVSLITRLEGVVYEGPYGKIEIKATSFNSHYSDSAENILGADFSLIINISDRTINVKKAVLYQAKKDPTKRRKELCGQIKKMQQYTSAPKVLELPKENKDEPLVFSGNLFLKKVSYSRIKLSDYIVRRILTCIEGDTRQEFLKKVQTSKLPKMEIIAKKNDYK